MADQLAAAALARGSGRGRELAKRFAQEYYYLVIVARSQDERTQTANELKQPGTECTNHRFLPQSRHDAGHKRG